MQRRNHDAYGRYERNGWFPHTDARAYICGWCGCQVSSDIGLWKRTESIDVRTFLGSMRPRVFHRDIRVCTQCGGPTTFIEEDQHPRPIQGSHFDRADQLDDVVTLLDLYDEARIATSAGAFSCAVLMFRKLLMHVAVQQGADAGKTFVYYCSYLKDKGVVGRPQHGLLDRIKDAGNRENHEVGRATAGEAEDFLRLATLLIESIYFSK